MGRGGGARRKLAAALATAAALSGPARAADPLEDEVRSLLVEARYMSPAGACRAVAETMMGWSAGTLSQCRYEVTDVHADGSQHTKPGIVILADPSAAQVAAWLKSACRRAAPSDVAGCATAAAAAALNAAGAQFPVAGLVWEDILCTRNSPGRCVRRNGSERDGVHEAYIFRNGVTVRVDGFANGATDAVDEPALLRLALAQIVTGIKPTGGYARIMSTSREAFARYSGRSDVPVGRQDREAALIWSDMVGRIHREALAAEDNPLVDAAVCESKGWPASCRAPSRTGPPRRGGAAGEQL